jgi:Protein of unknown function (DUF3320)
MAIGRRVRSAAGRLRRTPEAADPTRDGGAETAAAVTTEAVGPTADATADPADTAQDVTVDPAADTTPEPADASVPPVEDTPPWAVPYELADRPAVPPRPGIHSPAARTLLRDWFRAMFAAEAPIHESLLFARLGADWRIDQVGTRVLANIEPVLVKASVDGRPVTRDAAGFYRITGRKLAAVRVPATDTARRTPAQVPADELELAVTHAATDAPAPPDALTDRICALLRWSTVDGAAAVEAAIAHLLALAVLTRDADGTLRPGTVVPPG